MTNQVIAMHRQGRIPKKAVLVFGMEGELPSKHKYASMTTTERRNFWSERFESNLGSEGLDLLEDYLPIEIEEFTHNWLQEGF